MKKLIVMVLLLSGCDKPNVVYVDRDYHFECMAMCESTREKYENTRFDEVRFAVQKYCYEQCNAEFSKKKCQ